MNALDVHAIGWIVTRDLCSDAARTLVGLQPRLDKAALETLAKRWLSVTAAVSDDQGNMSGIARIVSPRRMALSARSERAMQAFIRELVATCPSWYSQEALRNRCLAELGQLVGSLLACFILASYVAHDTQLVAQSALGFFFVACWSFATTVQFLLAYRLAVRFASQDAGGRGVRLSGRD